MRSIVLLFITLALCGCKEAPDVSSPQTYAGQPNGLSFSYPGNWEITEDGRGGIIVQSPNSAYLHIQYFDKEQNSTLDSVVTDMMDAQREGADEMSMKFEVSRTDEISSRVRASQQKGVEKHFRIFGEGKDISAIQQFHSVDGPTFDVFLGAMDKEEGWERSRPGFQLIYDTFSAGE